MSGESAGQGAFNWRDPKEAACWTSNRPKFSWPAALINLVVVEEGQNARSIGQPAGRFVSLQLLSRAIILVAPTALEHELVPHQHLLRTRTGSKFKAPAQNFIIGPAFQHAVPQDRILDPDKAAAPAIEAGAQVGMVIGAQNTSGVETNFVNHPGEIDDAARAVVGAAGNGVLGWRWHGAYRIET